MHICETHPLRRNHLGLSLVFGVPGLDAWMDLHVCASVMGYDADVWYSPKKGDTM